MLRDEIAKIIAEMIDKYQKDLDETGGMAAIWVYEFADRILELPEIKQAEQYAELVTYMNHYIDYLMLIHNKGGTCPSFTIDNLEGLREALKGADHE